MWKIFDGNEVANGVAVYLFDEGCFATVNYDEC